MDVILLCEGAPTLPGSTLGLVPVGPQTPPCLGGGSPSFPPLAPLMMTSFQNYLKLEFSSLFCLKNSAASVLFGCNSWPLIGKKDWIVCNGNNS